jgi:phenylalanyl-tRNA synthetase alpha chain
MPDPVDRSTVDALRADFRARLVSARTDAELKALHDEFLSRKSGSVTGLLKQLGSLTPERRRETGALVNELKTEIESALEDRRNALSASRPPAGAVDVTLPGRELTHGRMHPLMGVRRGVVDIF